MARRAKGEGSITKRPDGSWQGSLQVDGRRRWDSGRTEKEVRMKLVAHRREALETGGALVSTRVRVLKELAGSCTAS